MAKKSKNITFLLILIFVLIFSLKTSALQLELHDRGKEVMKIQKYLDELGYRVSADGIFGRSTEDAVKNFQRENNLSVDGILGEKTSQLLEKKVSEKVSYELYVVNKGDTLSEIAASRNLSPAKLKEFNSLSSDSIKAGQDLKIPREIKDNNSSDKAKIKSEANSSDEKIYYKVRPGDTISEIAAKRHLKVEEILNANNLHSDFIKAGQEIVLPIVNYRDQSSEKGTFSTNNENQKSTIVHHVQRGDALITIARMYGTEVEKIKRNNNLNGDRIYIGQELVIESAAADVFRLQRNAFIWPVNGRLSSNFGWRTHPIKKTRLFHNGIDIAVPNGSRIKAAASGKVVHSGWMNGFGYTVIIDHGRGVETLYGHNSRNLVRRGENVRKGENIALSGNTGLSTGPHLHFGVLKNEKPLNPLNYLP